MCKKKSGRPESLVALLAEGVDRNHDISYEGLYPNMSPSSRRAWIEISRPCGHRWNTAASPSSRRAWIEITVNVNGVEKPKSRPPRGGRG